MMTIISTVDYSIISVAGIRDRVDGSIPDHVSQPGHRINEALREDRPRIFSPIPPKGLAHRMTAAVERPGSPRGVDGDRAQ
jgi:hypothetical protein